MRRNRKIHYHPCSTVCHGECEQILVKQIQVRTHKPLNPLSEKNGRRSIIINTVNDYLSAHFPTEKEYILAFKDCLKVDKKRGILDHKIFVIMDKDDTPDTLFEQYKNGQLFLPYWWGKKNMIVPIYFYPNMDEVFKKHGYKIDTSNHKPAQYLKLLTLKYSEVVAMLKSLSKLESNIKDFIEYVENYNY